MTKENKSRRKRAIKCPVCGKALCKCGEDSEVDVTCHCCNSALTITTDNNRIMVCESDLKYGA